MTCEIIVYNNRSRGLVHDEAGENLLLQDAAGGAAAGAADHLHPLQDEALRAESLVGAGPGREGLARATLQRVLVELRPDGLE